MKLIIQSKGLLKHNHVITGYSGSTPYLYYKTNQPYVDGIERGHIRLYGKCDICGKEVKVANIHTDSEGKLYKTKLDRNETNK